VKYFGPLSLVTICAGSLLAQSTQFADRTTQQVRPLAQPADVSSEGVPEATSMPPAISNILTVIGPNSTGVPCYDCATGAVAPNLGLLSPLGIIHRNVNYQVDVFLMDNSYTGSCTYTIAVYDYNKQVIVSTNPTFSETANTRILLGTAFTIPSTATLGPASISTTAVCGTSTTKSSTRLYIER
jgi:hypothetical protein